MQDVLRIAINAVHIKTVHTISNACYKIHVQLYQGKTPDKISMGHRG